ncbi:hypothetical protein BEN30_05510 [Magnetovibrio blakemorei]|uniref:DUF4142 domain-containing protein n=2 Tax=Magnetovibrio blakemorei TaxID=28181 RepID=A0A1E5QA51_9PROT|nr:hypothetical protein BEN30_05510 [Magnetovibrio blakemorei]
MGEFMLKRFIIVSLAIVTSLASGISSAAEQDAGPVGQSDTIRLTTNNLSRVWQNINEIILVLSANIALEDEWIQGLRDLKPNPSVDTSVGPKGAMTAFRKKLDVLLTSNDLAPTPSPSSDADDISALYVDSGMLLDNLVYYLIHSDTLASVSIYYGGEDIHGATDKDVLAEIDLASQRLDALISESGL